MAKKAPKAAIGSKLVARLKRFTESLEGTEDLQERFTTRKFKLNLKPQVAGPELVKSTRDILSASQAIFAQFLGVSVSAVQDWEQGQKSPGGAACRLMEEIRRNPSYFQSRLRELSVSSTEE